MECVSCGTNTNKYKCSKCAAKYCSLSCYKLHKDSPACKQIAEQQEEERRQAPKTHGIETEPTLYAPFSSEDTVSPALLHKLNHHEPLRRLLYNPHLRSLLQQIDVAYNAGLTMTAAMQEPLFVEFADACLEVVEPMTDAERAELKLYNQ